MGIGAASDPFAGYEMGPMPASGSLYRSHPRRLDIPILAGLAGLGLGVGVALPALEIESSFGDEVFSVLSGIQGFVLSGNILLACLLFAFSIAFPAIKVGTVIWLWFRQVGSASRREVLGWLEWLGKWSLLDTFVIAILLGTVQLGMLGDAVVHPGVYAYLAAILLSLLATYLLRRVLHEEGDGDPARPRPRRLWVTVPSALLYGTGLSMPLMKVEKGWFWESEFSLLQGIAEMYSQDSVILALTLAVFVVVLPSLRLIGLIALRLMRAPGRDFHRLLRSIDLWSMADVFVLACLVVFSKLGSLAEASPRPGLWCLIAAALLSSLDSLLLHRSRPQDDRA